MENQTSKEPKFLWIINIVIGLICLIAILCYFFGALWEMKVAYTLTADQLEGLIGTEDNGEYPDGSAENTEGSGDIDLKEIIGDEGVEIKISISLKATDVFAALGSPASAFKKVVNDNVEKIVNELMPTLNAIAKKTVKTVAKQEVKKEVHNQVKDYLANKSDATTKPEEVEQKLEDLGFTDDYISEKTDKLIDDLFEDNGEPKTVDSITESVMETVDEVYDMFKENSKDKEEFKDFQDIELKEEDRDQIEDAIRDVVEELADENGNIDPNELIAQLLNKFLNGDTENEDENGQNYYAISAMAISSAEEKGSDRDSEEASATEELVANLRAKIDEMLPEEIIGYLGYSFYAIFALIVLSMIPWLYVIIKLIVKFATHKGNTTVKLKWPIWFGWLFFLLFAGIPSLAVSILNMRSILAMLPEEIVTLLGGLKISFFSISLISAVCALCLFAISIYYMVVRSQIKKAKKNPPAPTVPNYDDLETPADW